MSEPTKTPITTQDRLQKAMKLFKHLKRTNTKVYISGPISGINNWNAPAFEAMESNLKLNDLIPVNPLKIVDLKKFKGKLTPTEEWNYCMKADIKELMGCSAVFTLDNWRNSMGATWEVLTAKMLSLPVLDSQFNIVYLSKPELTELYEKVMDFIQNNDLEIKKLVS